jgi:hypothetical protein
MQLITDPIKIETISPILINRIMSIIAIINRIIGMLTLGSNNLTEITITSRKEVLLINHKGRIEATIIRACSHLITLVIITIKSQTIGLVISHNKENTINKTINKTTNRTTSRITNKTIKTTIIKDRDFQFRIIKAIKTIIFKNTETNINKT